MTIQRPDPLHDLLADAASDAPSGAVSAPQLRARAVRRRARRRALQAGALATAALAVVVGVAVTGLGSDTAMVQPADPTPTAAPTSPVPTDSPTDGATAAPTDVLTLAEAEQELTGATFRDERLWDEDLDFPPTRNTDVTSWAASGCWGEAQEVPKPSGALGMRTVVRPGAESGQIRQLAVFPDASEAAAAFKDLRATIRGCQAASTSPDRGGISTEFVGGQLQLGDESFWTADRQVVVSQREGGMEVGTELFYSVADLLVLDGNVVTVFSDPAFTDRGRAETLANLSAEWEQLRPQYAPMLR